MQCVYTVYSYVYIYIYKYKYEYTKMACHPAARTSDGNKEAAGFRSISGTDNYKLDRATPARFRSTNGERTHHTPIFDIYIYMYIYTYIFKYIKIIHSISNSISVVS